MRDSFYRARQKYSSHAVRFKELRQVLLDNAGLAAGCVPQPQSVPTADKEAAMENIQMGTG